MRNEMISLNGNCIFLFYLIHTFINFEEGLKRNKWKKHIQCIYVNCCVPAISVLSKMEMKLENFRKHRGFPPPHFQRRAV